jgi:hypothetical protein
MIDEFLRSSFFFILFFSSKSNVNKRIDKLKKNKKEKTLDQFKRQESTLTYTSLITLFFPSFDVKIKTCL